MGEDTFITIFFTLLKLSFLSKIKEKVVPRKPLQFLDLNSMTESFQSAYRDLHSTLTALFCVLNEMAVGL